MLLQIEPVLIFYFYFGTIRTFWIQPSRNIPTVQGIQGQFALIVKRTRAWYWWGQVSGSKNGRNIFWETLGIWIERRGKLPIALWNYQNYRWHSVLTWSQFSWGVCELVHGFYQKQYANRNVGLLSSIALVALHSPQFQHVPTKIIEITQINPEKRQRQRRPRIKCRKLFAQNESVAECSLLGRPRSIASCANACVRYFEFRFNFSFSFFPHVVHNWKIGVICFAVHCFVRSFVWLHEHVPPSFQRLPIFYFCFVALLCSMSCSSVQFHLVFCVRFLCALFFRF